MRGVCIDWKTDPGPCPVDDAPHTTCTSPDYAPTSRQSVVTTVRRPRVLDQMLQSAPVTFTTKTYSRAKHGRKKRVP